ncbi:hypothetical protein VSX61_21355 [Brenneria populi subsp. brevivirga]|uniref:hypothetical protein n=1 Tax=Brenneria populi TaxID=1505588 RepID=UPI002E19DE73|nr:hypothetical protein [Brenneria populi subsp. brevivirga]
MLISDARYQLFALYSAQHLRAVANRIIARTIMLPPLHFSALLWRKMWLSPLPPLLQPDSINDFLQKNGCPYPRPYGLQAWITPGGKPILDIQSSDKLIYLANLIEKDWRLGEQSPVWRKHPTNRLNGYAYNIIQILLRNGISDDYPKEDYVTLQYDLLKKTINNKRLNEWIDIFQKQSKDPFVMATMALTRISNMRSLFLWQISLETQNGMYTTFTVEATPGDSYLSYCHPAQQKRVHTFIGYI